MIEPWASSTARETMFSEAISSISWLLAAEFRFDGVGDLRIGLGQGGAEEGGGKRSRRLLPNGDRS